MYKKAQKKTSTQSSSIKRPKKTLLILIIIVFCAIFLYRFFSPNSTKYFTLEEKGNKIIIRGLEKEEIDKINWSGGMKWTLHPHKEKKYQLRFESEESYFRNLIQKPTIYYAPSKLSGDELKDKDLEFENFPGINKRITKSLFTYLETNDSFSSAEKKIGFKEILSLIINLFSIFIVILFIDGFFGTNFIGFFTSFFKSDDNQKNIIPNITFNSIGGLQEAKEELREVVDYFRNPQIFWQRGAVVPKGILLVGPPGNGKTLLAKALAGECGLPFLFRAGSEFEEMVVGLGSRRVRELFLKARVHSQGCIIFIDEIDSIGRKRYSANNHTEMTLNQLLNELDGFRPRDNIVIIAATNSLDVLDPALLRPGRFDRQIYIPLPNQKGRREIIALYVKKMVLRDNFDLEEIVSLTKGLSGAQIANMFNEASILSIRYGKKTIDQELIFEAYDRVLMGPSLTSHTVTPETKKIVAYHEAGHAIIGLSLPETIVRKITIIPRWLAGGYTWIDLLNDRGDDNLINKSQMLAHAMSFLGGRASEELIFGDKNITIGATDDFKKFSEIVRDLILRYSMSELGIVPTEESFFYGENSTSQLSEKYKKEIENERKKIFNQCWKRVKNILKQRRKTLVILAEELLKKNSLQREEINFIFVNNFPPYVPLLKPRNNDK